MQHHPTIKTEKRTPVTARRTMAGAVAALAAVALALGAVAAPSDAQAMAMGPGDGFYWCLKAGGNYMECWYWWNFLTLGFRRDRAR